MPEVEGPIHDSGTTGDTQPLSDREVEHLRGGNERLPQPGGPRDTERSQEERRQEFINQATATLRRAALKAERGAEALDRGGSEVERHNAEFERQKAIKLHAEADQAEAEAGAEFDSQTPA